MRYLTLAEVLELHERVIAGSGGITGVRDLAALEASVNQPKVTFSGKDLYPSIIEKAAALCFSLVLNHPFLDGNKRAGHAAMEVSLVLNGYELSADIDAQEKAILDLAAGRLTRNGFTDWVEKHTVAI